MATATSTTSHTRIQRWVKARGGHPARVSATGKGKDPGILRIDFPGYSGADTLEEISWDEFFEWFDRNNLAMLLADGPRSRFNKLVARGGAKKAASKKSASKKAPAKKAAAKKTSAKKSAAKKTSSKKRARR
ncbi:MAG TPA: hypothetical protein VKB93_20305 [Thermoanaerobaculia bacterium]|nr:hypothetical protein [Thermoanaerobaculia bacterium]